MNNTELRELVAPKEKPKPSAGFWAMVLALPVLGGMGGLVYGMSSSTSTSSDAVQMVSAAPPAQQHRTSESAPRPNSLSPGELIERHDKVGATIRTCMSAQRLSHGATIQRSYEARNTIAYKAALEPGRKENAEQLGQLINSQREITSSPMNAIIAGRNGTAQRNAEGFMNMLSSFDGYLGANPSREACSAFFRDVTRGEYDLPRR